MDNQNNYASIGGADDAQSEKVKAGSTTIPGVPGFPFDLNNLLNFQFDQLKLALEYLARQQGDQ